MDFDDSSDVKTDNIATNDHSIKHTISYENNYYNEEKRDTNTKDDEMLIKARKNNELMYNKGMDMRSPIMSKEENIQQNLETQDSLYDNPMLYTQGIMPNGLNTLSNDILDIEMANKSDNVFNIHTNNNNTNNDDNNNDDNNNNTNNDDNNNKISNNDNNDKISKNDYLFLGTQVQSRLDDYDKDNDRIRTFEEKINAFKNKMSDFNTDLKYTNKGRKLISSIDNNTITTSKTSDNIVSQKLNHISETRLTKKTKNTINSDKNLKKNKKITKPKPKLKKTPKTISEYNIVNHARTKNMMLNLLSGKKRKLKVDKAKLTRNQLEKETVLTTTNDDFKNSDAGSKSSFTKSISASSNDSIDTPLDYPTYSKHEWEFVLSLLRENNVNDTQNEEKVFYEIYGKDYKDTGFITERSANETIDMPLKNNDEKNEINQDHKYDEINKTVLVSLSQMYGDNETKVQEIKPGPDAGTDAGTDAKPFSELDTMYKNPDINNSDILIPIKEYTCDKLKEIPIEVDDTTISQVEPFIITSSPDHVVKLQTFPATTPDAADTVIPNTTDEESLVNFPTKSKMSQDSQPMKTLSQKDANFEQNTQDHPICLDSMDSMQAHSADEHDEEFFYTPLSYTEKKNTHSTQKRHGSLQKCQTSVENTIDQKTDQDRVIRLTQRSFNAVSTLISPLKKRTLESPSGPTSTISGQNNKANHFPHNTTEREVPKVQVPATRANSMIITAHPSLDLTRSRNLESFPPIVESLELDYTNANIIIPESQEDLMHYSPNKIIESPSLSSSKHKQHRKSEPLVVKSKSLTISTNQNTADWENLSPKDLSEALKRLGIPTSNLKNRKLSAKKNNMPAPLLSRSNSECTAEYLATLSNASPSKLENSADPSETTKHELGSTTRNPKQNLLSQLFQLSYTTYDEFFEDLFEFVQKDDDLLEIIYTYQVISFQWFLNYLLEKCSKRAGFTPSPIKPQTALHATEQSDTDLCSRLKIMLENIDSKLVKKWGDDQGICFGND